MVVTAWLVRSDGALCRRVDRQIPEGTCNCNLPDADWMGKAVKGVIPLEEIRDPNADWNTRNASWALK
jgi:hypothetical protein